ncbi:ABC transporter ATP-binding protein [Actinocrinis sp.]|uniref:ABC transporter ATP-binding protein n=1 Tax=Actinocrinis sp. TaxID=1920516 RepID=UPI002D34469E|nr:ABC transporter ATP-binding protein [Actinocrinis sp.]HZP54451.1 ABC transporter ATP-binding protein [Actinocrinis sp.]
MIEIKDVSKRYGGKLAVDGLSFNVRPGMVTGFLGPNGAGKSTTMRMILGLDEPDRGEVTIDGRRYNEFKRPLYRVGALLDATAVHGGRSARAHLESLARSNGMRRGRVDAVLEQVGLTEVASKHVGGFSLGMKQRLGIAAALLGEPQVLMFDEPVNGLDPQGVRWVRGLFRSLAAEGRTVLVSSHLLSEMAQTADHLVVIGRGRLIADTGVEEFVEAGSAGRILVRTPYGGDLARLLVAEGAQVEQVEQAEHGMLAVTGVTQERIGDVAAAHGLAIHELRADRASLEEAFMELTEESVEYRASSGRDGSAEVVDAQAATGGPR